MQDQPTGEKRCNICGETKPLMQFWADHRKPDGRQTRCAACANRRRAQTKLHGPPSRGPKYIEEDRGHRTPCWIWQGSKTPNGYGVLTDNGRRTTAHRVYYEREHGPIPVGLHLDHLCRQHDCVNPGHLEPVPCAVNIRRGRSTSLTPDDVGAIRAAVGSQRHIAERFGVSQPTVSRIRAGRTWA